MKKLFYIMSIGFLLIVVALGITLITVNKNSSKLIQFNNKIEKKSYKIGDIKTIKIKDFVGEIKIEKSHENKIETNFNIHNIVYNEIAESLEIKEKRTNEYFNIDKNKVINIYYKENEYLNVNINDIVGTLEVELPRERSILKIEDAIGIIKINVNSSVNIYDLSVLGKIKKDVKEDLNSTVKIYIDDFVGVFSITNKPKLK